MGKFDFDSFVTPLQDDMHAVVALVYMLHGRRAAREAVRRLHTITVCSLETLGVEVDVQHGSFAPEHDWDGNN